MTEEQLDLQQEWLDHEEQMHLEPELLEEE